MPPLGGIPFGTSNIEGDEMAGITQLTGDVTAGPGSGSQVATIGANKVTTPKIADGAVTTDKLEDDAVTNIKLFPEAVTIDKMAPDSVGPNQLLDRAVGFADKLQQTVTAGGSVLGSAAPGNVVELPFGAPARDIGSQTTVDGVLSVLGLRDVGDLRNFAIAQAKQRLNLPKTVYPQTCIDEAFVQMPGVAPCLYSASYGGITINRLTTDTGGWCKLTTDGSGTEGGIYLNGFPSMIANPAGMPWYALAVMRFPNCVANANQKATLNLVQADFGLNGPQIGVYDTVSGTKFALVNPNADTGVPSTVDLDNDFIHIFEMWIDPDTQLVRGSVDFEPPLTAASTALANPACPVFRIKGLAGGDAASQMDIGHLIFITRAVF